MTTGPLQLLGPLAGAGLHVRNVETLARLTARIERPPQPAD